MLEIVCQEREIRRFMTVPRIKSYDSFDLIKQKFLMRAVLKNLVQQVRI
jgi:hypothetical protein